MKIVGIKENGISNPGFRIRQKGIGRNNKRQEKERNGVGCNGRFDNNQSINEYEIRPRNKSGRVKRDLV